MRVSSWRFSLQPLALLLDWIVFGQVRVYIGGGLGLLGCWDCGVFAGGVVGRGGFEGSLSVRFGWVVLIVDLFHQRGLCSFPSVVVVGI
jgi:hypothetical protein